jgi:hypothetical protein
MRLIVFIDAEGLLINRLDATHNALIAQIQKLLLIGDPEPNVAIKSLKDIIRSYKSPKAE